MCGHFHTPTTIRYRCLVSFTYRPRYGIEVWSISLTDQSTVPTRYRQLAHPKHFNLYAIKTSLRTIYSVKVHRCVNVKYRNSKKMQQMPFGCDIKAEKYLANNVKTVQSVRTYTNSRVGKSMVHC